MLLIYVDECLNCQGLPKLLKSAEMDRHYFDESLLIL